MSVYSVPEPMAAEVARALLAAQLGLLGDLLAHLDPDGLGRVRRWLRHDATWQVAEGTPVQALRALTLDATCRRLAARDGAWPYYVAAGDALPDAPDDAADLDTAGGC